jgi:hypothetical protein
MFIGLHHREVHHGGYLDCLVWACQKAASEPTKPALLFTCRPGEKVARIIAEVTAEGERIILNGRLLPLKKVRNG